MKYEGEYWKLYRRYLAKAKNNNGSASICNQNHWRANECWAMLRASQNKENHDKESE
jgi:hypothetical protein